MADRRRDRCRRPRERAGSEAGHGHTGDLGGGRLGSRVSHRRQGRKQWLCSPVCGELEDLPKARQTYEQATGEPTGVPWPTHLVWA
ncbi:MAG: hypothetical protein ACK55R_02365 [Cyanobacteriota bacterium]